MERLWCDHVWRYQRSSTAPLPNCSRPTVLHCDNCDSAIRVPCKSTREDRCAQCGARHRRNVARVFRSGFTQDRPEGFFFVTLTAGGESDGLMWDRARCGHSPGECSGDKGCRVERVPMAAWNATAPQRWSWFVTEMRRQLKRPVQFCGSWEVQGRGALHRHALIWCPGITRQRFRAAVRLCAFRYGFGRQHDTQAISGGDAREIARKAGYCAAYCTKGGDRATTLNVTTGELRAGGYRPWSASRQWGQTMKAIRAEQLAWVQEQREAAESPASAGPGGEAALDLDSEIYAVLPDSALAEGCH